MIGREGEASSDALARAEADSIASLTASLKPLGIGDTDATRLWIALKSKGALLIGCPHVEDGNALATTVAHIIVGGDTGRCLRFQGHPWWAERSPGSAKFVIAQERLTMMRLCSFLTEPAGGGGKDTLYFVLFLGISRAELQPFLVRLPRHLKTNILRSQSSPNGFMDQLLPSDRLYILATAQLEDWLLEEVDVLDTATVLLLRPDQERGQADHTAPTAALASIQATLYASRHFDPLEARKALPPRGVGFDPLRGLRELLTLLRRHLIGLEAGLIRDAFLYLGNAWDATRQGLYTSDRFENAELATSEWLIQSALPRLANAARQNADLARDIEMWLANRYPQALHGFEMLFTNLHAPLIK